MSQDDGIRKSQGSVAAAISADRPVEKLEEDELGHRPFAEAIAQGLDKSIGSEGLVIAMHGSWGAGKTSAVNMAIDALSRLQSDRLAKDPAIIVRFNPWWFSEHKDLVRIFFTEISAAIGEKLSSDIKDGFRRMAKRVSGASDLVAGVLALTPAGLFAKPIADAIKASGEGIDDERSLDEIRDQLAAALKREKHSVIVIIDDVDRLPADEARQIFRLVKSVADLPYITYLLVFDKQIAARNLELPSDPEGPEWLEKIIQVSFDLPPVSQADLANLLFKRLNSIVGDYTVSDHTRWGNILYGVVMPWVRSPRDVGRLANTIGMAWPVLQDEVDFPDLIAIETMRLFEPKLYAFIRTQRDRVTGHESERSDRRSLDAYGEKILSYVSVDKHERVKTALCYIFPRLDAVFNNTWHGSDWRDAEQNKRIQSQNRFPVYFDLGVGDENLSKPEFSEAVSSLRSKREFRSMAQSYAMQSKRAGGSRGGVLLDALSVQAHSGFGIPDDKVARSMLSAADLFLNPNDGSRTAAGPPRSWAVSWMIDPVLSRLTPAQIEKVLADALDGPSLYMAAFFLHIFKEEHGLEGEDSGRPEAERRIPLAAVKRLEKRYIDRIKRDAESNALLKTHRPATHIFAWSREDEQAAREWVVKQISDDSFAIWLMSALTSEGSSHSWGDMVSRVTYSVDKESMETLVSADLMIKIAERIVRDKCEGALVAKKFIEGLNSQY